MTPPHMNGNDIADLIAGGETLAVEFMSERDRSLSDCELVEKVVCLTNRSDEAPGFLLLGVEDNGRVTGAQPRHEAGVTDPFRVQALIASRTRPALSVHVELVEVDGGQVLAIRVPATRQPIGTADGRYLRRAVGGDGKPACVPFHFHEMPAWQGDRGLIDYTSLRLDDLGIDALEPLEFERYRRAIREGRGGDESLLTLSDLELAKALGAVDADNGQVTVRVLGLLLFGRREVLAARMPGHEVAFQAFSGLDVEVNDFFRWPLLRTMEELEMRFRARNRERELLVGMSRIGVPDYSATAFREGVANALVHRDYARQGAVHVQWHADRLTVFNPGGFPEGVTVENSLVAQPRPRNPLLSDAFKRAGIVERTGRGIDTISREQVRSGRRAPHYEATETGVMLTLQGGPADLEFVNRVVVEERRSRPFTLDEMLILNELWQGAPLAVADAARLIQKRAVDALDALRFLAEGHLVETGTEAQGSWRLAEGRAEHR